jgi:hypothetical protein
MKLITPILLLVAGALIFFWFINPKFVEIKATLATYQEALDKAVAAETKWEDLTRSKDNISDEEMARLMTLLPEKVDQIRLVVDMDALAKKYNAKIKDIKVNAASADTGTARETSTTRSALNITNVTFSIPLTYSQFLSYLRDLEKTLKLVDVSSVTFTPVDTSNIYNFSVNLRTYSLK